MFRYIMQMGRSGIFVLTAGAVVSLEVASAANRYWDGTGTSWDTPASWSTASGATTPNPLFKPGAADTAIFNITTVNTPQTVNLDAAQSALGLVFNSGGSVLIQCGACGLNTLTLGADGITTTGGGADTISSPVNLAAAQTWTNNGNKLTVSGDITNGANLLTIDGAGPTTISGVLGSGSGGLTKNGAGQLVLSNDNTFTGGVTINGGTLRLDNAASFSSSGDLTIDGGSLTANTNAHVSFVAGTVADGATVTVASGAMLTHSGTLELRSASMMNVDSGARYELFFTTVGTTPGPAAQLLIDGQGTRVFSTFAVDVGYGGSGVMTVTGGAQVSTYFCAVGSFGASSIGTLTLSGRAANGDRSSWTNSVLNMGLDPTSEGTIFIQDGALLDTAELSVGTPGKGTVFVDGVHSSGVPSLLDVGGLNIGFGNGTGDVTALHGGRIDAGNVNVGASGGAGTLTITDANSTLVQSGASTITVGHASLGSAAINVRNNATFTTGTGAINVYATGQINLESGGVFDAHGPINLNGGQFQMLGGTLHVDAFNGNLLNESGTLAPGHSAGATAVSGNYTQRSAAKLEVEVGGVLPGQWDMLTVEGNAILEGTLEVKLIDGFEPVLGNSFTILTTNVGNVGGQFDSELLPVFNDLTFDVIYNPKSVVIAVIEIPLLMGDYNQNGVVDAADYVVWRDNEGTMNALPNDPLGGTIGQAQFDQWRANFGQTAPVASSGAGVIANATVPESSTLVLLIFAATGWCLRRRQAASKVPITRQRVRLVNNPPISDIGARKSQQSHGLVPA